MSPCPLGIHRSGVTQALTHGAVPLLKPEGHLLPVLQQRPRRLLSPDWGHLALRA